MDNFYESLIDEIQELIWQEAYAEAAALLRRELSMPYIPADTEKELKRLAGDLKYLMSSDREIREESLETLLGMLKKGPESQLAACARLSGRNLRECTDELQAYLSSDPWPEAAALLIDALAEQEVGEEFTIVKDDIEYTFWPDAVTPVAKSRGIRIARSCLDRWLGTHHPDLFEMASTLLVRKAYMFLPLSYEEEEGYDLAKDILDELADLMQDETIRTFASGES